MKIRKQTRRPASADRARRLRRLEQPQRAVAVQRHEALGVVALAAAIPAGHMGETRMDQRLAAVQRRGLAQPPAGQRVDLMPRRRQAAGEKAPDQPACAGKGDPHAGSGRLRESGTGPSPA